MKSRMIVVGSSMIGIIGIDEVLSLLLDEGREPSEELKRELLDRIGERNYIPKGSEEAYGDAFLREYEKFYLGKNLGNNGTNRSLGTWQGIPREEIPWFPTVIEGLCNGCKACLNFCPYQVYEWDEGSEKVRVANPYNCFVGCSTCALKCEPKAIMFPPSAFIKNIAKKSR
jgi:NAD-dependent dihydropyrimidine dehydrogenase PreA subunit